jgi:hypothetical protein
MTGTQFPCTPGIDSRKHFRRSSRAREIRIRTLERRGQAREECTEGAGHADTGPSTPAACEAKSVQNPTTFTITFRSSVPAIHLQRLSTSEPDRYPTVSHPKNAPLPPHGVYNHNLTAVSSLMGRCRIGRFPVFPGPPVLQFSPWDFFRYIGLSVFPRFPCSCIPYRTLLARFWKFLEMVQFGTVPSTTYGGGFANRSIFPTPPFRRPSDWWFSDATERIRTNPNETFYWIVVVSLSTTTLVFFDKLI